MKDSNGEIGKSKVSSKKLKQLWQLLSMILCKTCCSWQGHLKILHFKKNLLLIYLLELTTYWKKWNLKIFWERALKRATLNETLSHEIMRLDMYASVIPCTYLRRSTSYEQLGHWTLCWLGGRLSCGLTSGWEGNRICSCSQILPSPTCCLRHCWLIVPELKEKKIVNIKKGKPY